MTTINNIVTMQKQDIQETVKKIKRSFSLQMNGVVSQSMREKGVAGYVNWGIQLPALRKMAAPYGKDYELAVALWKENVRECKILATLVMPVERMDADLVSLWMEQTSTQEIAEYAAFNVYQHMPDASLYAYVWIASANKLTQICGFSLLSCLFKKGGEPRERDINEFVDQAVAALSDESISVRHAAMNALNAFAAAGEMQSEIVSSALKRCM